MVYTKYIVIIVIFIVVLVVYLIYRNKKSKDNFTQMISGFAEITDPYQKPYIIQNLIQKNKCHKIMDYASNRLTDSHVISGKNKNIRNSKQCWIPKNNILVKDIYKKVSEILGMQVANAEDLQVVRYQPGQYYNEHHDACCNDNAYCKEFVRHRGQRKATVLIYLNEGFEGGHTYFKNLDLKLRPNSGDAIVFFPLAENSCKCHPLALHAGMPVESGEKWIANIWFRENKY